LKLIVFIAVHKNETQVNRLIRALDHPDIKIYIHIDKKSGISADGLLPAARIISKSIDVEWRAYSQVKATINSLKEIISNEPDFDYLTFISGQDYPILIPDAILSSLQGNMGREFIEYVTLDKNGWNGARIRFERFYFIFYSNPFIKYAGKMVTFICDKFHWKRNFFNGMTPYGGSAWWSLSRECIVYILNFMESRKGLERFMKKTIHADEILFQTIVMNSPFKDKVVNNNFRFIKWLKAKGNGNPCLLTRKDFPEIMNSQMHFARKFDMDIDAYILDMIDDYHKRFKV